MLVSILIPVYNSEEYLETAIQSAIEQSWNDTEIIIVDDGSTDASYDIARKYAGPNLKVYRQEHLGAPSARNMAFMMSSGEYIQYLDADDYMDSDKIEVQLEKLAEMGYPPDAVAFCPHYRLRGEKLTEYSNNICFRSYNPAYEILIDFWLLSFPSIPSHSYLCPRDKILDAGKWDVTLEKNQDCDFFAKIIEKCSELIYCKDAYVYYRDVPNSISKASSLEKIRSELMVNETITKIILSKTKSAKAIQACSFRFTEFLESHYPLNKSLIKQAVEMMKKYRLSLYTVGRGTVFSFLLKGSNWVFSLWLFSYYKRLKQKKLLITSNRSKQQTE